MNTLAKLKSGETAEIKEFHGGKGFIAKLYKLGIQEGVKVKIKKNSNICPILIEINGSTVAIGRGMASKILVKEA